ALNRPDTLPSCLEQCAKALIKHLDASLARIWLLDAKDHMLELQASSSPTPDILFQDRLPLDHSRIGRVARDRKPYITNDLAADPEFLNLAWASNEGVTALAAHPLIVDDRVIGVMSLLSPQPISANVAAALGSVADHIGLGIERQRAEAARQVSDERF